VSYRTLTGIFSLLIASSLACQAGSADFADFGANTSTSVSFTLNGISGTITDSIPVDSSGGFQGAQDPYTDVNFQNFFGPDTNLNWEHLDVNGPPNETVASFTMTFTSPITDPTIYIENLDNSQEIFSGATDGNNNAVSGSTLAGEISVVSGNNAFTTGLIGGDFAANYTQQNALNGGCEGNDGSNPSGTCAAILLTGTYSSISWYATDANIPDFGDGDGWSLQMSVDVASAPEPGTCSTLGFALVLLAGWKFRSPQRTRRTA
jgi:hypothetical protein